MVSVSADSNYIDVCKSIQFQYYWRRTAGQLSLMMVARRYYYVLVPFPASKPSYMFKVVVVSRE